VKRTIGVFAKYWQPGAVKTRLAAGIGEQAAAQVYRAFVASLLDRFGCIANTRELAYTPPERVAEFRVIVPSGWRLVAQCSGDLGARMTHYFAGAFERGATQVVLVGSDSPTVPDEYLELAFAALEDNPVVLGPSEDGGYYLLGARREMPRIFEGIPWSTQHVWAETIKRLEAAGCGHHVLPTWYDVDSVSDLQRLSQEVTARVEVESELERLHAEITRALSS
jgi:rSAM/selenodomain-associated transferase 1